MLQWAKKNRQGYRETPCKELVFGEGRELSNQPLRVGCLSSRGTPEGRRGVGLGIQADTREPLSRRCSGPSQFLPVSITSREVWKAGSGPREGAISSLDSLADFSPFKQNRAVHHAARSQAEADLQREQPTAPSSGHKVSIASFRSPSKYPASL